MEFSFVKSNHFKRNDNIPSLLVGSIQRFDVKDTVFTIFIPTYKRPQLLAFSFQKALQQKKVDKFEIIVCDNNEDQADLSSYKIAEQLFRSHPSDNINFFYYRNSKNLGQIGNWNRGIELAHGRFLLMCHDDDWLDDNILSTSKPFLSENAGVAFQIKTDDFRKKKSFNQIKRRFSVGLGRLFARLFFTHRVAKLTPYDLFLHYMNPGNSGVIMETSKLKELGGYDESVYPFSDQYLFAFYSMEFGMVYVKKRRSHYRIAENESLKAAKTFPAIRYEFLLSMIPFIKDHSSVELKEKAVAVSTSYLHDASIFWGIPLNDFDLSSFDFDVSDPSLTKKAAKINQKMNWEAAKRYL